MAITKNVSFNGPYVGRTFQRLAAEILGRDGYLDGAAASDDGVNITLGPYGFVQGGVICRQDAASTLPVPSGAEPWFVTASAVDDDPATGIVLTATSNVSQVGAAVVLAYKMNGSWFNPFSISSAAVRDADAPDKGRESGLVPVPRIVDGGGAGLVVTSFAVGRGVAVDSRGERRELGALLPGMATFAPLLQGIVDRNDYVVLRRREAGAELVVAQGGAIAASVSSPGSPLDSGPAVTRPSVLAKRGGVLFQIAYGWSNGTALKLGSALELALSGSTVTGFYNPITVYTGAAQLGNVLVVGQRPSDRAIIVVFTEGTNVRMAAFSAQDGSVVNAPVRIDVQPNACTHVQAKIDLDGLVHIVYQHDEGGAPPSQQVYYTKRSIDVVTFGGPALTPRLVNGVNSTKNDTWPSLGVDRQRRAHIAYATGNGSDEFGQLRYAVLDQRGNIVSRATIAQFGGQPDPSAVGLVDATGVVANIRRPQVVVTVHDEVNIFMTVQRAGAAGPDEIALFNPAFTSRLSFPIVILSQLFSQSGAGTDTLALLGATSDDLGQLLVLADWTAAGLLYARLDTVLAPLGVLGDSYLEQVETPIVPVANPVPDILVTLGASGEIIYGLLDGTNAVFGVTPARLGGKAFTAHPDDVLLSGWQVDAAGDKFLQELALPETDFQVFGVRPKKMSYPILVGDDGDYQGYGSLLDALAVANRKGGHVVVRGGSYRPTAPLVLASGVRLEGEGNVVLDWAASPVPAGGWLQLGAMPAPIGCVTVGSVVTLLGAPTLQGNARTGDVCELFDANGASTGLFSVRRILDATRFVVDGTPSGTTVVLYACGVEAKNLTLVLPGGIQSAVPLMVARALWRGVIERVKISGLLQAGGAGLRLTYCRGAVARDVDVTGLSAVPGLAAFGISVDQGSDNTIEGALLTDADGSYLKIDVSTQHPRLVNCAAPPSTQARYQIDAPRTTPVYLTSCAGRVDGDVKHVVTPVGKMIASVTGRSNPIGALQLQDENTVQYQAGVPLDLTAPSAPGSSFNGATPHVLVPSVNERLLRAGDAMTGELGLTSMLLPEIANPAPPPAGTMRLYVRSNGQAPGQNPPQHRSQLVVLMPDGTTQVLAQSNPT